MSAAYCTKPEETPTHVPMADVLALINAYEALIDELHSQGPAYIGKEVDTLNEILIRYNITV
jgi:hypothetical protein